MNDIINEVEKELKDLCNEYIYVLEILRNEDIITKEVFEHCSCNKIKFLEK